MEDKLIRRLRKFVPIVVAEDDEEDQELLMEAFEECGLAQDVFFVRDGEELMDYLGRKGRFTDSQEFPQPGIIVLDLNMPRKDGRQVLKEIKSHSELRKIPIIILTTSKAEEDIKSSYELGVNSFIVKPVGFDSLLNVTRVIGKYWLEIVELPV